MRVHLVGNPNTGKTTLFNALTRSNEHVGNWHGVTVEGKSKKYNFSGHEIELVDLPGLYSLSTLSYEEEVAAEAILSQPETLVVNICDESNLGRNLFLTLSLMEFGANVILAINQVDKAPIYKINASLLSNLLGVPVVLINAQKKIGLDKLNNEIINFQPHKNYSLPYLKKLDLDKVPISDNSQFLKIKLLENDEKILKKLNLNKNIVTPQVEGVASARYDYIDNILMKCAKKQNKVYGRSKLDKVIMNRFLAIPIFMVMLALVFELTFFSFGKWLSEGLSFLLDNFIGKPLVGLFVSSFGAESWLTGLIENAVVGGAFSVLGFLPQVALLFLFLSILEDSGYMSRVAFSLEDIFAKVGLSGKSVYTLLMGFGCSTTAVLTARNMEDKNAKIKTGLLTPYMSCSAKFPVYSVIGGAFFGANNILVIMGLYLLGVTCALIMSMIFEKTILKSKEQTFILEFPPYHAMSVKRVGKVLIDNMKQFMFRVGSLIICMNVIVWLLSSFTFSFSYVPSGEGSILEQVGKVIAPIFAPLGFNSWALVSALIAGLIAKEIIVSSIALYSGVGENGLNSAFHDPSSMVYFASGANVISYLVFCLLYFPCLATMSVLRKEIGRKWTFIGIILQLLIAYIASFIIYNLSLAFIKFGVLKMLLILAAFFIIILSIVFIIKKVKNKKLCANCKACDKNCKKFDKN